MREKEYRWEKMLASALLQKCNDPAAVGRAEPPFPHPDLFNKCMVCRRSSEGDVSFLSVGRQ